MVLFSLGLFICMGCFKFLFLVGRYVTNWYRSLRFNTELVWVKDQCELGKFIFVEFKL
jgi:hypothetical protein